MKLQYIIQIDNQENYPFDGPKPRSADVRVRNCFRTSKQSHERVYSRVEALLRIKSPLVMQVLRVTETKGRKFDVEYEYVPEALKLSQKIHQASFVGGLNESLGELCKQLKGLGIRFQLKQDNMGITELGCVKVYIGLHFQVVNWSQQEKLDEQYQIMVEKFMESHFNYRDTVKSPSEQTILSDYSHRINKKLTEFQDRLNKMSKYGKQSMNSHHSTKNNQKPQPIIPTHKQQGKGNMFLDLLNSKKTVRHNTVATGLTSNSLIHPKHPQQNKPHKFSFADYSTQSQKLDDSSSKESSLTQRINCALEKTEVAFKVYERYSRKKQRKRS